MVSMSILWWLKKENVKGLLDHDKEQSMEIKSVVTAVNDTVRPAQSVVPKKHVTMCHTNRNRKQIA